MSVVAERIAELFTHAWSGRRQIGPDPTRSAIRRACCLGTGVEFVAPGDTVLARFPGIGEASVRIGQ